jgi:lipopolysaccharide heptosyltransferase I
LKILILKPSSLGDVVQALPVLRLIKKHLPQSEVYWWLDASLVPLLEGDPDLTGIIPFDRKRMASPPYWREVWQTLRQARAESFDWVIDLQGLARSGLAAWLANGDLTIGVDDPREGARGFYDVAVARASYFTHAVDWYLSVLPVLGVPVHQDFVWLPPRPSVGKLVRARWPEGASRWVIIQPGARWPNKQWPAEYYAEVVRALALRHEELHFAILGDGSESDLGKAVASHQLKRCVDLTGKISLPEMVEWIRASELMVTNDTGPMHVAAALGKPVVAIFGPTEPRRTGPYGQFDQVTQLQLPCVPCLKASCSYEKPLECLRAIPPAAIIQKMEQRLRSATPESIATLSAGGAS